ncbi:hypothetical protein GW932_00220 [archaeon]|nr:hypothetical protein [archaeon]
MIDIHFKKADSEKEIKAVVEFIRQFPLGYPGYLDWTEKVYYELMNGKKNAYPAIYQRKICGDLIFQTIGGNIIELKNLRIHDYLQRRGFADFMTHQLEVDASRTHTGIIVDTRKDNKIIRNLFEKRGYKQINEENLYDKFNLDVVYYKALTPNLKTNNSFF